MKYRTRKEVDKRHAKIEVTANKWLAKGFSLEAIAKGIWNHYGNSAEVKNGKVQLWGSYNGRDDNPFIFVEIG